MGNMSRKWVTAGAILLSIAAIIGAFLLIRGGKIEVPASFTEARNNGAEISKFINTFSEEAKAGFQTIEKEDREGNYVRALDLTIIEVERLQQARVKSVELLGELQKMTASLGDIKSTELQSVGMQAVSNEVLLVERLIAYNEHLKELLDVLRVKYSSYEPQKFDASTNDLVEKINDDVNEINQLNRKYQTLIGEFDKKIN